MSETHQPSMADLRLLVVDDDADQRMLVGRLLADRGISPSAYAESGVEAIELAALHQPHVILLDLAMPGRSGFDVLPDLQRAAPASRIIIVSNLPQRRLADKLRQRGAIGHVEKWAAPEQLVNEILIAAAVTELARDGLTINLLAHITAPRVGRRLVRNLLAHRELAILDDVELLVSELITNAVIHGSSAPQLEVRLSTRSIYVAIHDDDPTLPKLQDRDLARPGGRGLQLVDSMASRWGAQPSDTGKVVWFEVDRQRVENDGNTIHT